MQRRRGGLCSSGRGGAGAAGAAVRGPQRLQGLQRLHTWAWICTRLSFAPPLPPAAAVPASLLRFSCTPHMSGAGPGGSRRRGCMGISTRFGSGGFGSYLRVERRSIGDFGRASWPRRTLPLAPGRLSGSSRVRSAASSLTSQPLKARLPSCGAARRAAFQPAAPLRATGPVLHGIGGHVAPRCLPGHSRSGEG